MNDTDPAPIYLAVGLGNPGREFRENRHNAGFLCADLLAENLRLAFRRRQFDALLAEGKVNSRKVILAKPQTMMNRSGRAVAQLVRYYKIPLAHVILIYDELDLPLGSLRMRPGGGAGGHKGLSSVLEAVGDSEIPRLRIGIGRPPGGMDPADYVLEDFTLAEREIMALALERAVECVRLLWSGGIDRAMNDCNAGSEAE